MSSGEDQRLSWTTKQRSSPREKKRVIERLFDLTSSMYKIYVPEMIVYEGLEYRLHLTRRGWQVSHRKRTEQGTVSDAIVRIGAVDPIL